MPLTMDNWSAILNLPDLMLIAFLLFSTIVGAKRGPIRTLYSLLGRLGCLLVSFFAARFCAPYLAQAIITPMLSDVFAERAAQTPGIMVGAADAVQAAITETAMQMGESVAFLILLLIFSVGLGVAAHLIGDTLHLIGKLPPFGFLGRVLGMLLGLIGGLILVLLALWLIGIFRPDVYTATGFLSPAALSRSVLVGPLLQRIPLAP